MDFDRYCKHGVQPFAVYGIKAPYYPADIFGMGILNGSYELFGSAAIISAGLQTSYITSEENDISVSLHGIYYKYVKLASRFIERTVAELAIPEEHVVVLWRKGNSQNSGPINGAYNAGFQVSETEYSVICTGTGTTLKKLRWLKNNPAQQLYIIASKEPVLSLEKSLVECVNREKGCNYSFLADIREKEKQDSVGLLNELNKITMFAGLCGPDIAHAFINKASEDTGLLEKILSKNATEIGIPLYCVDHNDEPFFGLFSGKFWESHPLPQCWKRIVP